MARSNSLGVVALALILSTGCNVVGDGAEVDEDGIVTEDLDPEDQDVTKIYRATHGNCAHGGIEVNEHEWHEGGSHMFCIGEFADLRKYSDGLGWLASWNDRISSALVNGQVRVKVWEHTNFRGNSKIFYPWKDIHLGGTIWNDAISSMKITYYR